MSTVLTKKITLNIAPFLKSKTREATDAPPVFLRDAPITARAMRLSSGKISLSKNWDYRDELRGAILKKHY